MMLLVTFLTKIFFDWIYHNYIYIYFAYDTFRLDYDLVNNTVATLLLLLTTISMYLLEKHNNSMKIPIFFIFFSLIIPLATICGYESMSIFYYIMIIVSYNLLVLFLIYFPPIKIKYASMNLINIAMIIIVSIYIYTYSMLILNGGFARINFNFNEIYETRELLTQGRFPLSGYFINWIGYSFNPLLMVLGLYNKNNKMLFSGIILQLFLFGMTNLKAFIFAIPLLLVIFIISKWTRHFFIMTTAVITLIFVAYIHAINTHEMMFSSIFIRRQFFMPAHLHFLYHEFFSENTFIYLSNSVLENIIEYPYQQSVTRVISLEYWGRGFGTNVGIFGNAYYNFGYMGIFIFTFIFALISKFIVSFDNIIPKYLTATIILLPVAALVNSGLLTTLVTHSLLITIICVWLYASYLNNTNKGVKL